MPPLIWHCLTTPSTPSRGPQHPARPWLMHQSHTAFCKGCFSGGCVEKWWKRRKKKKGGKKPLCMHTRIPFLHSHNTPPLKGNFSRVQLKLKHNKKHEPGSWSRMERSGSRDGAQGTLLALPGAQQAPFQGAAPHFRPCSSERERINKSNGNLRKTSQREKAGRK